MSSLERLPKDVVVIVVYELRLCFIGREPDPIVLDGRYLILPVSVTGLEMKKLRVGVSFLQISDPRTLPSNRTRHGCQAQTVHFEVLALPVQNR